MKGEEYEMNKNNPLISSFVISIGIMIAGIIVGNMLKPTNTGVEMSTRNYYFEIIPTNSEDRLIAVDYESGKVWERLFIYGKYEWQEIELPFNLNK